jgi:T5SS/PEP-CTERM-associated repeat protein
MRQFPRHPALFLIIALLGPTLALVQSGQAGGTSRSWIGPDTGIFSDPKNWTPGGVPTGLDDAFFGLPSEYTVQFFTDPSHQRVWVTNGEVIFDLNSHVYSLDAIAGSSIIVGSASGTPAILHVGDGMLEGMAAALGTAAGSDGTLIVSGGGSGGVLSLGGQFDVGSGGTGFLNVMTGGQVISNSAVVGRFFNSSGLAWIEDTGSTWDVLNNLVIGDFGAGDLVLWPGATVNALQVFIGDEPSGDGEVSLAGAIGDPATLNVTGAAVVGSFGSGSLLVEGTSTVTTGDLLTVGQQPGSSGDLTVSNGPTVNIGAALSIGDGGDATAFIDGATVTASAVNIGFDAGSSGEVVLGPGGVLDSGSFLRVGSANGGVGSLILQSGSTATAASNVSVHANSFVRGVGTIDGGLSNIAGTVEPGFSAGRIEVTGGFVNLPDGRLSMEIGGRAAGIDHDQLGVTGSANLDGQLTVLLTGGFVPIPGDAFKLIEANGGVLGSFDSTSLPPLPGGMSWTVDYFAGGKVTLLAGGGPFAYRVSQWDPIAGQFVPLGFIEPYQTNLSMVDYYSLGNPNSAQYNFPPGAAPDPVNDRSHLFLVRSAVDGLGLCFVHDRSVVPLGGVGNGRAEMQWDVFGDTNGAAWLVQDDGNAPGAGDEYTGAAGASQFTSVNAWGDFADGGLLGPLDGVQWAMETRFTNVLGVPGNDVIGLTTWAAYSSDGGLINLALEVDRPVRIEIVPGLPCAADLDGDGGVTTVDLLQLLAAWGTCPPPCPEDLDGDGAVSTVDLLALLSAWGSCP